MSRLELVPAGGGRRWCVEALIERRSGHAVWERSVPLTAAEAQEHLAHFQHVGVQTNLFRLEHGGWAVSDPVELAAEDADEPLR